MVKVRFLFFGFELPLFILIAIVFFIGYYTAIAFRKRRSEDSLPSTKYKVLSFA
jgi:hypothetical protein